MSVRFGQVTVFVFQDDCDDRKPYWELFARDRARFRDRIQQIGETLKPILTEQIARQNKTD
jgi:hypothetical protein